MSLETDAIVALVHTIVPSAPVTATLGHYVSPANPCAPHSPGSYHCADATGGRGLAVDFGGDENMRLAVFHALEPYAHELAELFHNGPGITRVVKNGMWADGLLTLGAVTWAAHTNHVHVAVKKGVFLAPVAAPPPILAVKPMYDPPLQVVDFLANPSGPGGWALFPDGGIGGLGGCPWRGDANQPLGKPYWGSRRAARLEANGVGYTVVATDGGRYDYP